MGNNSGYGVCPLNSRKWIIGLAIMCLMCLQTSAVIRAAQTPSVEDIYAKLIANVDKVKDLKLKSFCKEVSPARIKHLEGLPIEWRDWDETYKGFTVHFWFLAPDTTMGMPDGSRTLGGITRGNITTTRRYADGKLRHIEDRAADFTLGPLDILFSKKMIDYLRKYEVVSIIGNPEPGIYVIKAEPPPGFQHKTDEEGMFLEITIDHEKGVLLKMIFRDPLSDNKVTSILEWKDHQDFSGFYMFTRVTVTNTYPGPTSRIDCKISDIQINNTGLTQKDFYL